jgi:L-ascorbate metabolism protein UlaG (beta-lactamase superfamily)
MSFDGKKFHNQVPMTRMGSFGRFLQWRMNREVTPWEPVLDAESGPPPPRRVGEGELRVTFINHATTLVQLDGLNLLTDPIWSERASPVGFAGPKRVRPPGIRFENLPPIDAVLLSHNHYDHFDLPTLERLARAHDPLFVVGLGNERLLARHGIAKVVALDWWQGAPLGRGLSVTAVPAQHWSNRGLTDSAETLWAGFVVEGRGGPIYYSGDTGWGPHFEQVAQRFGPARLAILPIGAFKPRWFMQPVHISPQEAVEAARVLGAGTSLAVHFGTFELGDDGQEEPPTVLRETLAQLSAPPRFWVLGFGEGRDVPPLGNEAHPTVADSTLPGP